MKISKNQQFLIRSYHHDVGNSRIVIVPTLGDAFAEWGPVTRVSPIFRVEGIGPERLDATSTLAGSHQLVFLGPVLPILLSE